MMIQWRVALAVLTSLATAGAASGQQPSAIAANAGGANWTANLFQPPTAGAPVATGYDVSPVNYSMDSSGAVAGGGDVVYDDCADDCLAPWAHRSSIFGELLYLRARDAEVAYALPVDSGAIPAVPAGPVAIVDPDYSAGFRVGATCAIDDCSSFVLTYSRFQSTTFNDADVDAPLVLRSLLFHPATANAGSDFLDANASLDVDFDLVDLDYRAVWDAGDLWAVNYLLGVRYARLQQALDAEYLSTGSTDTLFTDVIVEGVGLRAGIDGERHWPCCGLFIYGKGTANILATDIRARYTQGSDLDPVIADTRWEAGRLVTVLDLELGTGWQSADGAWRLTAGYLISAWYNTIATDEWIEAVQRNNYSGLGDDTISFDGLTARAEYRF